MIVTWSLSQPSRSFPLWNFILLMNYLYPHKLKGRMSGIRGLRNVIRKFLLVWFLPLGFDKVNFRREGLMNINVSKDEVPNSGWIDRLDRRITSWMSAQGLRFLRLSLGIIFLWFGFLKFFPSASPAQDLATDTIRILTFNVIPSNVILPGLATWECLIGLGLISGWCLRATLFLLFAQMLGTFLPLIFFPSVTFTGFPYAPTLEGQYIIKNLVLVSAGLAIGATVRGPKRMGSK